MARSGVQGAVAVLCMLVHCTHVAASRLSGAAACEHVYVYGNCAHAAVVAALAAVMGRVCSRQNGVIMSCWVSSAPAVL
jgi:hypothetical protein